MTVVVQSIEVIICNSDNSVALGCEHIVKNVEVKCFVIMVVQQKNVQGGGRRREG